MEKKLSVVQLPQARFVPVNSVREWLMRLDDKYKTFSTLGLYMMYSRDRRVRHKVNWENFQCVINDGM